MIPNASASGGSDDSRKTPRRKNKGCFEDPDWTADHAKEVEKAQQRAAEKKKTRREKKRAIWEEKYGPKESTERGKGDEQKEQNEAQNFPAPGGHSSEQPQTSPIQNKDKDEVTAGKEYKENNGGLRASKWAIEGFEPPLLHPRNAPTPHTTHTTHTTQTLAKEQPQGSTTSGKCSTVQPAVQPAVPSLQPAPTIKPAPEASKEQSRGPQAMEGKDKVANLERSLALALEEKESAQVESKRLQQEVSDRDEHIAGLEDDNAKLEEARGLLVQEIKNLKNDNKLAKTHLDNANEDVRNAGNAQEQAEERLMESEAQLQFAKTQCDEASLRSQELREKCSELEAKIKATEETLQRTKEEFARLHDSYAQLKEGYEALQGYEESASLYEQLKQDLDGLEEDLRDINPVKEGKAVLSHPDAAKVAWFRAEYHRLQEVASALPVAEEKADAAGAALKAKEIEHKELEALSKVQLAQIQEEKQSAARESARDIEKLGTEIEHTKAALQSARKDHEEAITKLGAKTEAEAFSHPLNLLQSLGFAFLLLLLFWLLYSNYNEREVWLSANENTRQYLVGLQAAGYGSQSSGCLHWLFRPLESLGNVFGGVVPAQLAFDFENWLGVERGVLYY